MRIAAGARVPCGHVAQLQTPGGDAELVEGHDAPRAQIEHRPEAVEQRHVVREPRAARLLGAHRDRAGPQLRIGERLGAAEVGQLVGREDEGHEPGGRRRDLADHHDRVRAARGEGVDERVRELHEERVWPSARTTAT